MNVRELFTRNPASCGPDTNLAAAAELLWERDCGILPVVDDARRVIGVLTDRDICMALATRDRMASQVAARDVMTSPVQSVGPDASASHALKVMRQHRVRRLPVVDEQGILEGVLSMNDLALASSEPKGTKLTSPSYEEVVLTLKEICSHAAPKPKAAHKRQLALV